ncbi:hypothetical protein FRC07_010986, partial [Ceratobasidium sp. 392]
MPAARCQRKSRKSQPEPMGSKTQPVAQSTTSDASPKHTVIVLDSNPPSTPTSASEKIADAEESRSAVHSPVDAGTPDDTNMSHPDDASNPGPSEDTANSESEEPLAISEHALEDAAPAIPKKVKCDTLGAAIKQTQTVAAAQAANGNPLTSWLTPLGNTGNKIVDQAMYNMKGSKYCLWLGNVHKILQNCKWFSSGRVNTSTLQWKPNAPDKPVGAEGDAIIGFLGMASLDGSSANPDAGWQLEWGENKLQNQKQTFHVINPGVVSKIPHSWWETQIKGANLIIENGQKLANNTSGTLSHCFLDRSFGTLRVRAPIFLPLPTPEECRASGCLPPEPEGVDLPSGHRYSTWKVGSERVREAFDKVIARGFKPQPLEAYSRHNKLIHPNNVTTTLSGAIVVVYCTLERALFTKLHEWQFYANLIKVQALKLADPTKSAITSKRKFTHGYGPDDPSASEGSSSKIRKTVRFPVT